VHRGGRRLETVLCLGILVIGLSGSISAEPSIPQRLAWALGDAASDTDPGYLCLADFAAGKHLAAFRATASNPYMLEGLVASRLRAGFAAPFGSIGAIGGMSSTGRIASMRRSGSAFRSRGAASRPFRGWSGAV
jgi:hypothetical protein